MKITAAIRLIEKALSRTNTAQIWADLGCGTGTFTSALAQVLPPQSLLYAIDRDSRSLNEIPEYIKQVRIQKHTADMSQLKIAFPGMDGFLLANSLHYIPDKARLIKTLSESLQPGGRFLIVEYDTSLANQWVPYPLRFSALGDLFEPFGFQQITKLGEYASLYGDTMYSAVISR
ncbi:MAG: class I SAM-dependent methyltransferase [Siphonobacter sp.]